MTITLEHPRTSDSQTQLDPHIPCAVGAPVPEATPIVSTKLTPPQGPLLRNTPLLTLSDTLDDIEALRKATGNRIGALTRSTEDKDGEVRGQGFPLDHPIVATTQAIFDDLVKIEEQAVKNLEKEIKKSPLYPWVKASKGIGAKQAARLIAVIQDPYWNTRYDRPRLVSELWAYCGYSVINGQAQRRQKGVLSNWSSVAKSRAFLMAEKCVVVGKGGKYEALYRELKAASEGALHTTDCVRCGPSGKPALAGSELSAGHRDARAKRQVAKEILKDLWLTARDYYDTQS